MVETAIREMNIATDKISIQLRAEDNHNGYSADEWPLATVSGGIEEIRIRRRGDTTTITIKSPEAVIWCEDVHRPPTERKRTEVAFSDASLG